MNRLKTQRFFAGLSQKKLAEKSGTNQAFISLIENERIFPGEKLKTKISAALNKPKEEVFPRE